MVTQTKTPIGQRKVGIRRFLDEPKPLIRVLRYAVAFQVHHANCHFRCQIAGRFRLVEKAKGLGRALLQSVLPLEIEVGEKNFGLDVVKLDRLLQQLDGLGYVDRPTPALTMLHGPLIELLGSPSLLRPSLFGRQNPASGELGYNPVAFCNLLGVQQVERQRDLFDIDIGRTDGQQFVLAASEGGFGLDPTRFDGCRRPDHDGDPGGGNLFGNSLVEFVSRQELSIPPDRETSHFEITGEIARGLRCFLGIGNENIGHARLQEIAENPTIVQGPGEIAINNGYPRGWYPLPLLARMRPRARADHVRSWESNGLNAHVAFRPFMTPSRHRRIEIRSAASPLTRPSPIRYAVGAPWLAA